MLIDDIIKVLEAPLTNKQKVISYLSSSVLEGDMPANFIEELSVLCYNYVISKQKAQKDLDKATVPSFLIKEDKPKSPAKTHKKQTIKQKTPTRIKKEYKGRDNKWRPRNLTDQVATVLRQHAPAFSKTFTTKQLYELLAANNVAVKPKGLSSILTSLQKSGVIEFVKKRTWSFKKDGIARLNELPRGVA